MPRRRNIVSEHFEYVTPDGVTYKFDGGARAILSFDGFGMAPVEYLTQKAPNQHGETPVDYRFQPRIVQIVLREDTGGRAEYWDARANLIDMLRPNRQALNTFAPSTFKLILPTLDVRCLSVLPLQGPSFSGRDPETWDEYGYTEALRFIAHDPIFYSEYTRIATIGPITNPPPNNLVFPFTFRGNTIATDQQNMAFLEAGGFTFVQFYDLYYFGTFPTWPTITIVGPVNWPNVMNYATGERLILNYTVANGETVIIHLDPGDKWVESTINGDITYTVADPSPLTTWHIDGNPASPAGKNTIGFFGLGALSGQTVCTLVYRDRWVGQ